MFTIVKFGRPITDALSIDSELFYVSLHYKSEKVCENFGLGYQKQGHTVSSKLAQGGSISKISFDLSLTTSMGHFSIKITFCNNTS